MTTIPLQSDEVLKRQIFEKCLNRMKQMDVQESDSGQNFCPELNPDVIVVSRDRALLFESQNEQASILLHRLCGTSGDILAVREQIYVHPSESQRIITALSAAGLTVAS